MFIQIQHKEKVEKKFKTGNIRDAKRGSNAVMGRKKKPVQLYDDPHSLQINVFYSRFGNSAVDLNNEIITYNLNL